MQKTKSSFLFSSFLAIFGYNFANFLHFLANFALIKALAVDLYGEYLTTTAYATLLTIPLSIIILIITKIVGQLPSKKQLPFLLLSKKRLWQNFLSWWWWLTLALLSLLFFINAFGNFSSFFSLLYLGLNLILSTIIAFYAGFLQGRRNFKIYYQSMILAALIKLLGFGLLYFYLPSLVLAYAVLIIAQCSSWWWTVRYFRQQTCHLTCRQKVLPLNLRKFFLSEKFYLPAITMTGLLAFANLDLVLTNKLLHSLQAGYYAVLTLFSKIISYALTPVTEVVFAFAISRQSKAAGKRQLFLVMILFIILGVGATIVYYYAGVYLIPLVSKREYLALAPWLPAMAIFGSLQTFNLLLGKQLVSHNQKRSMIALAIALLQGIGIFIFHQNFSQIIWVNLITSAILLICYWQKIYQLHYQTTKGKK